jgi:hypothetical protein
MLNQIAMIFGYFMLVMMALFCLYVLYITIRDHFAEKKATNKKYLEHLREEIDNNEKRIGHLICTTAELDERLTLLEESTKKTESAMEEPKGGICHEEVSGKPEGPDREQVRERGQDEGA